MLGSSLECYGVEWYVIYELVMTTFYKEHGRVGVAGTSLTLENGDMTISCLTFCYEDFLWNL